MDIVMQYNYEHTIHLEKTFYLKTQVYCYY